MDCNICKEEMKVIKTTGESFKYMCFNCGNQEVVPKHKKKEKWYNKLIKRKEE